MLEIDIKDNDLGKTFISTLNLLHSWPSNLPLFVLMDEYIVVYLLNKYLPIMTIKPARAFWEIIVDICDDYGELHDGEYYNYLDLFIIKLPIKTNEVQETVGGEDCFGRCGAGCLTDVLLWGKKYTQDCFNHDACADNLAIVHPDCNHMFVSCVDDYIFAFNCDKADDTTTSSSTTTIEETTTTSSSSTTTIEETTTTSSSSTTTTVDETSTTDDFEDGVIDTTLWVVDGENRGCGPPCGSNTGDWNYTHQEITDPIDGYLELHVWGPASGNTYGAEAWVRTSHDFNDGSNYTINFTWEPDFDESHYNYYFIQVTDGYISSENNLHWNLESYPGTCNLLRNPETGNIGESIGTSPGKLNWSVKIEPSGVARLYDGSNATGTLKYECSLDSAYPWYIRFMVSDGTSSGFSAGDAQLNLYDFATTEN